MTRTYSRYPGSLICAAWRYHQLNNADEPADIAIGLGGHDIRVAEHAAELYAQRMVPRILFTGDNAPTTGKPFPWEEADHLTERAIELGAPPAAILIEPGATNTTENIILAKRLLQAQSTPIVSAILVSWPHQQRRALAAANKQWPELIATPSSRPQSLTDYLSDIGDIGRVLNMLAGDTQRIWVYADCGHATAQPVDSETMRRATKWSTPDTSAALSNRRTP